MDKAVSASAPARNASAKRDASSFKTGDDRVTPGRIWKVDAAGLPTCSDVLAQIDQRFEDAVFGRINVIIGSADLQAAHRPGRGYLDFRDPEVRQDAADALVRNPRRGDRQAAAAAEFGAEKQESRRSAAPIKVRSSPCGSCTTYPIGAPKFSRSRIASSRRCGAE